MGTHRLSSYSSRHRVRFAHPEFTEFIVHRRTASRHPAFVVVARARVDVWCHISTVRSRHGGDGYICLSLFVCVHTVYVDSNMYRVSEERRVDTDRLDRTPPHALVVETFVRPSVEPPAALPSPRDGPSVGRAVGRAVGRPRRRPPPRRRRRRRRRPHSSTFRASHVRDRAILFLRHHRVRLRASLGVASSRARRRFPDIRSIASRSYPRSREDTRCGWERWNPTESASFAIGDDENDEKHACVYFLCVRCSSRESRAALASRVDWRAFILMHSTDARARANADRRIVPPRRGGVDVDDSRERILVRRIGFAPRAARTPADARPSPRARPRNRCGCPAPPRPRT